MRFGRYWARFSVRGISVHQSLKTKKWEVALNQVEKMHANILLGKPPKDDGNKLLFREAWAKFLRDKELGVCTGKGRPRTVKEYHDFGQRYFLDFWGSRRIDRITTDDWSDYIAAVTEERGALKFFNHHKYMQGFFSWAYEKELIRKKPKLYNPDPRSEDADFDGVGKNYSDVELKLLYDNAEGTAFRLWVLSAMFMGTRSSELTQLKKDRISLSDKMIRLKKSDTKTKEARVIAIHAEVFPLLKEQYEATESLYLFPNKSDPDRPMDRSGFKRQWENLREKTGVEGRYHDLRHSFASRAFANPKQNPVLICKYLGMSMRTAEKCYIHFTEKQLHDVADGFTL